MDFDLILKHQYIKEIVQNRRKECYNIEIHKLDNLPFSSSSTKRNTLGGVSGEHSPELAVLLEANFLRF